MRAKETASRRLVTAQAAAEAAASKNDREAAARAFQRAALHLEILRLLGGRPLAPALETSRRYARWRARHLSHVLENCVLEHSPEDPRSFEGAYAPTGVVLGKGGYGVVVEVARRADGARFACVAARTFRGDEPRRRRGRGADLPWRRAAATPRPRRGPSVEIGARLRCKRLDLGRLSAKGLARLHEEVAALRALDHPHICRLREVFYCDRGRRCYLVMDLCRGGELFAQVHRPSGNCARRP